MKHRAILLVEDIPSIRILLTNMLRGAGFEVVSAASIVEAQARAIQLNPDVILLDLRLPDGSGLDFMKEVLDQKPETQIIAITADSNIDMAVEVMRLGAYDFLAKPVREKQLIDVVSKACALIEKYNVETVQKIPERSTASLIGSSPLMTQLRSTLAALGKTTAAVYITGEAGTGKSLCATILHENSNRKNSELICVNCSAISPGMVEVELFGELNTDGRVKHPEIQGALLLAQGGTIFLDNVNELDVAVQARLLRFLDAQNSNPELNIRIICTSSRDPYVEIQAGRLREDLFFRLNVVPLNLPPLRARGEDVIEIAETILKEFAALDSKNFSGLSDQVKDEFRALPWPGNVRQLLNVIWNVTVLFDGPLVTYEMLPGDITRQIHSVVVPEKSTDAPVFLYSGLTLAEIERSVIEAILDQNAGSVPKVARVLDVSPSTLYRKMEAWGYPKPRKKPLK